MTLRFAAGFLSLAVTAAAETRAPLLLRGQDQVLHPLRPRCLGDVLSSFTRAEPALQSLTVTRDDGAPAVATTDDVPAPQALTLARQALKEGRCVAPEGQRLPAVTSVGGRGAGLNRSW